MGRLRPETLERWERFADRVLEVCETLLKQGRFRRVIEQVAAAGTSAAANLFEADQAMSRPDFIKTMGIVTKELNETKFWIRLVGRRGWMKANRLEPLLKEADELLAIANAIIVRVRRQRARTL